MTGHLSSRRPTVCPSRDESLCEPLLDGLPKDAGGLPLLAKFCDWARAHKIRVLATFPNMADRPVYRASGEEKLERRLRRFYASLGVPVVGGLNDALMPPAGFFDTQYHPTEETSLKRSAKLAELLKPWFAGRGVARESR